MTISSVIRPRKSLAFPLLVVLYPLLWLVVRATGTYANAQPVSDSLPEVVVLTAGAILVSYAVAVVVDVVLLPDAESVTAWIRRLLDPSTGTIVLASIVTIGLAAYFGASSLGVAFPSWLAPAERGVGLILGWPIAGSILVVYFVSNTLPLQIPPAVQLLAVSLGAAFTAAWLFLLASGVSTLASRMWFGLESR